MEQTSNQVVERIVYVEREPEPLKVADLSSLLARFNREVLHRKSKSEQLAFEHSQIYIGMVAKQYGGVATKESASGFVNLVVERFQNHGTRAWVFHHVKSWLKWCVSLGLIDERQNPLRNARIPKAPPRPPPDEERLVTVGQYQKLRHHASGSLVDWIVLLGWNTGMALVDCCSLKWQHVDIGRCCIVKAREKTGSYSTIPYPMGGELDLALRAKREIAKMNQQDGPEHLVSPENHNPKSCRTLFDSVVREAGLEGITFHSFRYTFCSMLMSSGMNQIQASKVTGHQSPAMLSHYTILKPEDLSIPVERAKRLAGRDAEVVATQEPKPTPAGSVAIGWGFQPGARYEIKFQHQPKLPDGRRVHLVRIDPDQPPGQGVGRGVPTDLAGNVLMDEWLEVRYQHCRKWREIDEEDKQRKR